MGVTTMCTVETPWGLVEEQAREAFVAAMVSSALIGERGMYLGSYLSRPPAILGTNNNRQYGRYLEYLKYQVGRHPGSELEDSGGCVGAPG